MENQDSIKLDQLKKAGNVQTHKKWCILQTQFFSVWSCVLITVKVRIF